MLNTQHWALPDPTSRYIYIVSPKVHRALELLILGHTAVPVLTHWRADPALKGGGRTVPHTLPEDACFDCVTVSQRPRWHAFLACWSYDQRRYCLADLTTRAVQTCPDLDPARKIDLRGRRLRMQRDGTSYNSPVKAIIHDATEKEGNTPASFDVREALMRLWGLTSARAWAAGQAGDFV